MQQGGLCVALREKCSSYVNHSGAIRDSMSLLRKQNNDRDQNVCTEAEWCESLVNWFPWLTTLSSALARP